MPDMVTEERTVYSILRQREVRCRLWYRVSAFPRRAISVLSSLDRGT